MIETGCFLELNLFGPRGSRSPDLDWSHIPVPESQSKRHLRERFCRKQVRGTPVHDGRRGYRVGRLTRVNAKSGIAVTPGDVASRSTARLLVLCACVYNVALNQEMDLSNETVDQVTNNAAICIKVMGNFICSLHIIMYEGLSKVCIKHPKNTYLFCPMKSQVISVRFQIPSHQLSGGFSLLAT